MKFFLRYVLVYLAVALVLLFVVAYTGFEAGMGGATWIAVALFALWMLVYHPLMLWLDYRRMVALVTQLRAGQLDGKLDPAHVRESVLHLAVEYGNVPELVATLLVRRVLTDEAVQQLAARLRASASRQPPATK